MNKRQKLLLFLVFFLGTTGVISVDRAYAGMMDREPRLCLALRRVDQRHIKVSALGRCGLMDLEELKSDWEGVKADWDTLEKKAAETLDGAVASVKGFFAPEEEEDSGKRPLYPVDFPAETL